MKGGQAGQAYPSLTGMPGDEAGVPLPVRYQLTSGYVDTPAPGVDLGGSPDPPRPVGHRHSAWVGGAGWGSWPAVLELSWALSPEGLLRPLLARLVCHTPGPACLPRCRVCLSLSGHTRSLRLRVCRDPRLFPPLLPASHLCVSDAVLPRLYVCLPLHLSGPCLPATSCPPTSLRPRVS